MRRDVSSINNYYFDTSALLKEFVSEVGSDVIRAIMEASTEGRLDVITSQWSINEAVGVIVRNINRKINEKHLTRGEAQLLAHTFITRMEQTLTQEHVHIVPVQNDIVLRSRKWIIDSSISPSDAIHLCTADIFNCSFFLVHDKNFVNKVKRQPPPGLKIIDLSNETDRNYLKSQLSL